MSSSVSTTSSDRMYTTANAKLKTSSLKKCFCYQYFHLRNDVKKETIFELIDNGFDGIKSLMAMDVVLDLDRMKNISLGERALVRKGIHELVNHHLVANHRFRATTLQESISRLITSELGVDHNSDDTMAMDGDEEPEDEVFSTINERMDLCEEDLNPDNQSVVKDQQQSDEELEVNDISAMNRRMASTEDLNPDNQSVVKDQQQSDEELEVNDISAMNRRMDSIEDLNPDNQSVVKDQQQSNVISNGDEETEVNDFSTMNGRMISIEEDLNPNNQSVVKDQQQTNIVISNDDEETEDNDFSTLNRRVVSIEEDLNPNNQSVVKDQQQTNIVISNDDEETEDNDFSTLNRRVVSIEEDLNPIESVVNDKQQSNDHISNAEETVEETELTSDDQKVCYICGDIALKKDFPGGMACKPCLLFYQKYRDDGPNDECTSGTNDCLMSSITRGDCRSCRWNRCLKVMARSNDKKSSETPLEVRTTVVDINLNVSEDSEDFDEFLTKSSYVLKTQPIIPLSPLKEQSFPKITSDRKPPKSGSKASKSKKNVSKSSRSASKSTKKRPKSKPKTIKTIKDNNSSKSLKKSSKRSKSDEIKSKADQMDDNINDVDLTYAEVVVPLIDGHEAYFTAPMATIECGTNPVSPPKASRKRMMRLSPDFVYHT